MTQFETAMETYDDEKIVKIFTSGSFFDDKEIKPNFIKQILPTLYETAEKVSVESRPDYITDEKLLKIKEISKSKIFEIGIGLETANNQIRESYLNKGFKFDDYKKATKTLKKHDVKLKTYVLIKPPFLTEKESIDDALQTVEKIKNITDTISFNPVNVQRNTLVSLLWNRKMYRPPWLFSVVEILKKSKNIIDDVLLKCDIAGGGSIRGAHNCKNCDKMYLKSIQNFSLYQDVSVFENLDCICREKWLDQLDIEDLGFGSLVNMYG
jgi:radical SAM enzyme (TIGR01210 family)